MDDINIDEIIDALNTEIYCKCCPHDGGKCLNDGCWYINAATLIKQQQKELDALREENKKFKAWIDANKGLVIAHIHDDNKLVATTYCTPERGEG